MRLSLGVLLFVLSLGLPSLGMADLAQSLRVNNARVTSIKFDRSEVATRIGLTFSVQESDGKPVNGLKAGRKGHFRVFVDGVQETSFETLTENSVTRPPTGVTLVLDTSYSMEDQKALGDMKKAAETFVSRLERLNQGFKFEYYQFATYVRKIKDLSEIDTKKASGRFTSMYSAVMQAISEHPQNIIVLFTDGADNRSPANDRFPVNDLKEITDLIGERVIVHTVKLGIEKSNDSQGVDNREALKAISRNGSLSSVANPNELAARFEAIAAQVSLPYSFEYLCSCVRPGRYSLRIDIDPQGVAEDDSRWSAKSSLTFDFEVFGHDNRVISTPSEALQPSPFKPVLIPSFGPNNQNKDWFLMRYDSSAPVFTPYNFAEGDLSPFITASFNEFALDANSRRMTLSVKIELPKTQLDALREKGSLKVYLHEAGFSNVGVQRIVPIAEAEIPVKNLVLAEDADGRVTLHSPPLTATPLADFSSVSFVALTAEVNHPRLKRRVLGWNQNSVVRVR